MLGFAFAGGLLCTFACTLTIGSLGLVLGWICTFGTGALLVGLILTLSRIARIFLDPLLPLLLFLSFLLFLSSFSLLLLPLLRLLFLPLPSSPLLPSSSFPSCSASSSRSCSWGRSPLPCSSPRRGSGGRGSPGKSCSSWRLSSGSSSGSSGG